MPPELGLTHLWSQGDPVTRAVALLLPAMAIASWSVLIVKALALQRYAAQRHCVGSFWHGRDFDERVARRGSEAANAFPQLALQGREAAAQHGLRPRTTPTT